MWYLNISSYGGDIRWFECKIFRNRGYIVWEEIGGIILFVNDVIKLEICVKKNLVVGMMNWLKFDLFWVFLKYVIF